MEHRAAHDRRGSGAPRHSARANVVPAAVGPRLQTGDLLRISGGDFIVIALRKNKAAVRAFCRPQAKVRRLTVRREGKSTRRALVESVILMPIATRRNPADLDERARRQRCGQGRLDEHRAAGRDGRDHLVDDEVERVVERADGEHHRADLLCARLRPFSG